MIRQKDLSNNQLKNIVLKMYVTDCDFNSWRAFKKKYKNVPIKDVEDMILTTIEIMRNQKWSFCVDDMARTLRYNKINSGKTNRKK